MSIAEASALLDNAVTAWHCDPQHAREHLDAALKHAGELQRALVLEQIRMDKAKV